MTASLKSLFVQNFRSIRGEASLSLDAPVILLYGPNGAGKTSLMSALELALTGSVASLEKIDPEYAKYLPHKYADSGKGLVRLKPEGFARRNEIELEVSGHAMDICRTRAARSNKQYPFPDSFGSPKGTAKFGRRENRVISAGPARGEFSPVTFRLE
jgi:DNA repair exonuclease SbcCD ATPase subunit